MVWSGGVTQKKAKSSDVKQIQRVDDIKGIESIRTAKDRDHPPKRLDKTEINVVFERLSTVACGSSLGHAVGRPRLRFGVTEGVIRDGTHSGRRSMSMSPGSSLPKKVGRRKGCTKKAGRTRRHPKDAEKKKGRKSARFSTAPR